MAKEFEKYTIECGFFLYPKSVLRVCIVYGAESMINIKEDYYRKIDKIEEEQIRLLFSRDRSYSIQLLYLEAGQILDMYQF